jgi:hypothetical protein
VKKRPLSPDVFEIDMKGAHYKFPWGAISSIMNRATGVALSAGAGGGAPSVPRRRGRRAGGGAARGLSSGGAAPSPAAAALLHPQPTPPAPAR